VIITALAGLEEGVINEQTTLFCPGYYRFGNRVYRCWKRGGHGKVDIIKAVEESCDVFFYQVGERLGVDRLAWYAKAFGLGSPTGIFLDQEAYGLIPTAAWKQKRTGIPWQEGETLSVAIGQGFNLVTPIQMALVAAAVGNGGNRYRPMILDRIMDRFSRKWNPGWPGSCRSAPIILILSDGDCGKWSTLRTEPPAAAVWPILRSAAKRVLLR